MLPEWNCAFCWVDATASDQSISVPILLVRQSVCWSAMVLSAPGCSSAKRHVIQYKTRLSATRLLPAYKDRLQAVFEGFAYGSGCGCSSVNMSPAGAQSNVSCFPCLLAVLAVSACTLTERTIRRAGRVATSVIESRRIYDCMRHHLFSIQETGITVVWYRRDALHRLFGPPAMHLQNDSEVYIVHWCRLHRCQRRLTC